MKNKIYVITRLFIALAISATIQACSYGTYAPHREELHNKGKDICQTNPERCINGIPW